MENNGTDQGLKQEAGQPVDAMEWIADQERHDPQFADLVHHELQRLRLGEQLRKLREEVGVTQTELAARIGTSQSTVARIEAGRQANVTIGTLLKFARALNRQLAIDFTL